MLFHRVKGEFYLLFATIFAAIGWLAAKMVLIEMPSGAFIGGRFILASLLLLPFCYKKIIQLSLNMSAKAFAIGLLLAASIHIWVHAVHIAASLSEGAFIMSLAMIIAPLTRWLIFKNVPNGAFWLSLPFAILGMILLTLNSGWKIESSQWYFLLSSGLLSIHFVLNKRLSEEIEPLSSICVQMGIVGITGVIAYWLSGEEGVSLSNSSIMWFLLSVLVATSLRYLAQTVGQYTVKIENSSLIMILEPVWTLVLSIVLLDESLNIQKLLGSSIIILSLCIYILLSRKHS
ncbi:MAG: DMT family transporter [Photobacterium frigidiphilum]|uniref:DMT family transporter n=1 Tax=Photobacterium frigidiphilum TaxID=264736 RepID=UPI0030036D9D